LAPRSIDEVLPSLEDVFISQVRATIGAGGDLTSASGEDREAAA
jgi:hypothetical protein